MKDQDVKCILADEEKIKKICAEVAQKIDRDYKDSKNLVFVCVLKGAVMFFADLVRKVQTPAQTDFMRASSYGNSTSSSGELVISLDINRKNIENEDIIIVEDICDSGWTLKKLTENIQARGAKSVATAVLLDKPSRREVDFVPDYIGMTVDDLFVIGYGLDYAEKYRTIPYIGVIKEECI